jgi:hypothetical protein
VSRLTVKAVGLSTICKCLLASLWLASCEGSVGELQLQIVTAPNSMLLAQTEEIQLTVADRSGGASLQQRRFRKTDGAFELNVEIPAMREYVVLQLQAFDSNGAAIARGETPPLVLGPVSADVAIYVGAPLQFGLAPAALTIARTELSVGLQPTGALLVGGIDDSGQIRREVDVYNAYTHTLTESELPTPRKAVTIGSNGSRFAYVLGGIDSTGDAVTGWRFDPSAALAGQYQAISGDWKVGANQVAIATARSGTGDVFVLSGDKPRLFNGIALSSELAMPDVALPAAGAFLKGSTTTDDTVVMVGTSPQRTATVTGVRGNVLQELSSTVLAARIGHSVLARDNDLIVVGGSLTSDVRQAPLRSIVIFSPITGQVTQVDNALMVGRLRAAVAMTNDQRWLVVAGGTDESGEARSDAEIINAMTLMHQATVPLAVARVGGKSIALPNGQLLLVGGVDGSGCAISQLELFVPGP